MNSCFPPAEGGRENLIFRCSQYIKIQSLKNYFQKNHLPVDDLQCILYINLVVNKIDQKVKQKMKETDAKGRILKAAKREFSKKGFKGARTARIAEKARVNKALIHYYYKSKEMLYIEVLENIFGRKSDSSIPYLKRSTELTPSEKIYLILYFMNSFYLKVSDPDIIRIFSWEIAQGDKFMVRFIDQFVIPRKETLVKVIEEGIENGEFDAEDANLAALEIFYFIFLHFVIKQLLAVNDDFYAKLYRNASDEDFFNYTVSHVFKSLSPKGEMISVPGVNDDIIGFVDDLLGLYSERYSEGLGLEVIHHFEDFINNK